MVLLAGCTSFEFQLSQTEGLKLKMEGAPPTLYKLGSYAKESEDVKAFDVFHFESQAGDGPGELHVEEEDVQ